MQGTRGTSSWSFVAERSEAGEGTVVTGSMSEERYAGAKKCRQRYVSRHNLKMMGCG